jgi:hypothetical protein
MLPYIIIKSRKREKEGVGETEGKSKGIKL